MPVDPTADPTADPTQAGRDATKMTDFEVVCMKGETSATTAGMSAAAPQAQADPTPAGHVSAWAVWSLRTVVLAVAILVFLQPVLAGRFLAGDAGMRGVHSTVAGFITASAFLQFVAAIPVWRPGRGPSWPIWSSLAFFLVAEVQAALGYARVVSLHVPLGVLLFGFAVAMVIATWSPKLRVRRP